MLVVVEMKPIVIDFIQMVTKELYLKSTKRSHQTKEGTIAEAWEKPLALIQHKTNAEFHSAIKQQKQDGQARIWRISDCC